MCCFFFVRTLLENAFCLLQRIALCKAEVETSCREVRLRKASFAVIISLDQQIELLTAHTGLGLGALHPALAKPNARALICDFPCHGAKLFGCFSAKCLQPKPALLMVFGLFWPTLDSS